MDSKNILIPNHKKISPQEVEKLLAKHNLKNILQLPKIKTSDVALKEMELEAGDVVEITRRSFAGESKYYRVVIE